MIPETRYRQTPKFWPGAASPKNPTTRFLGAEIEVESGIADMYGAQLNAAIGRWNAEVHTDCAFELCTAPASGDKWVEQINEFCHILTTGQASVGYDCGCHVHIDARDLTPSGVYRLLHLICCVEPALYSMVPRSRRTNDFCCPARNQFKTWLAQRHRGDDTEGLLTCIYGPQHYTLARCKTLSKQAGQGSSRYLSFNIRPYFNYGTVECRLLEGCIDATRIINWGVLLAALVDFAKQHTEKEIDTLIQNSRSGLHLLLRISPSLAHRRWVLKTIREHNPHKKTAAQAVAATAAGVGACRTINGRCGTMVIRQEGVVT